MPDAATEIISDIMTALSNCALYSANHHAVRHFSDKAIQRMTGTMVEGALDFTVLDNTLLFNQQRVEQKSLHINNFIKKLRRSGVEKLVIRSGVTVEELAGLIADLASATAEPRSTHNISLGTVEVMLRGNAESPVTSVIDQGVEHVKAIHRGLARFGTLDVVGLEEVVVSFVSTLEREANILRVVTPVKSYSEYTFAHTTNVTLISIFQAEALGLRGDILYEIGLAGLLHDVGKMFVPREILEKESKLEPSEWEIMKLHTVYGARHLARLDSIPRLAVIAAYEHHMRYDGTGYPDPRRRGKTQHVISQIVAISDFFDALRTERPYRRSLEVPVVVGLLEKSSGTDFNPFLVANFIRALRDVSIT